MTGDELRLVIAAHSTEVRRHFDMTAEGLRHEVQLVAESVTDSRRETAELRSELRRGFEQSVSDIQAHLERVEGATH